MKWRYKFEAMPVEKMILDTRGDRPVKYALDDIVEKLNKTIETYNLENQRLHLLIKNHKEDYHELEG